MSIERIHGPTNRISEPFAQVCGRILIRGVCALARDEPFPLGPGLLIATDINGPTQLLSIKQMN